MVIDLVSLKVRSLEDMIEFYTKIIGLEVNSKKTSEAYLGVGGKNLIHLTQVNDYTISHATTGLYHVAFLLPTRKDLGIFLRHIIEKPFFIGASDHGYSEAVYLEDIEGNGIEVYYDKEIDKWDIRENGDIVGVTEPLDYMGLLKLGDEEFYKIPNGTYIGHIHLTVSDLNKTEEFYKDIVGMDLKMNFGGMAKFFSYNNYHHHIGANTWKGTSILPSVSTDLGLNFYELNVNIPFETTVSNLKSKGYKYESIDNKIEVLDPNGIKLKLVFNN